MSAYVVQAHARVQLSLEIDLTDSWGDDCKVGQIHSQATDSARNLVSRPERLAEAINGKRVRILGEPTVTAIVTERQR